MRRPSGWLVDALLAAAFAAVALVVERQTQGRLFTEAIVGWVGVGSFALLRLGAALARASRGLGCGFVFVLTWLLPCVAVLRLAASPDSREMVSNSAPFFVLLGFFLIAIMVVTFERIRLADEARFARRAAAAAGADGA